MVIHSSCNRGIRISSHIDCETRLSNLLYRPSQLGAAGGMISPKNCPAVCGALPFLRPSSLLAFQRETMAGSFQLQQKEQM